MSQKKKKKTLAQLTGAELDDYANQAHAVMAGLSAMDAAHLTPREQQDRNQTYQQALELASCLELERIRRLIATLGSKVKHLKAQAKANEEEGEEPPQQQEGEEGQP